MACEKKLLETRHTINCSMEERQLVYPIIMSNYYGINKRCQILDGLLKKKNDRNVRKRKKRLIGQ